MESIALFFGASGEANFSVGQLRLRLDLGMAQAFPAEVARLWRLPFALRVRLWAVNAEDVFDAAPGEFGEGNFSGFAYLLGAGEGVVGKLNLGSRHAIIMMACGNVVKMW